jgi:TP901 family phage tail tape measure protein
VSTQIALLVARFVADTSQFERKMVTANRIMGGIGKAGFFMGLGVAGGIGVAVKQAGDFQENLNVLQSVTGASAKQMKGLRAEAIRLGADLKLPNTSAQDAATTLTELAKGGLSVKAAMAAARGTIQLSTAAQIDNATAADIQARALSAFGLKGRDAGHVADLLAGAANKSTASIQDIALGMKQSAAVWHAGGQDIGNLTAALGEMANAGITGSDAGTSLKTMMQRLNPNTAKSAAEFKKLGVNVFDAHGNYRDMKDIIGQFHGALSKLNPEQRQHALYTIFGSDAIRAANVVLDGGTKKYDKMRAAVEKSGSAQRLAQAHTKGFNGALQGLISELQTAAINIGTLFLPVMTKWVRRAGELAGWLSEHPRLMKTILVVVGSLAVAMVTLTAGYKTYMAVSRLATFYGNLFGKSLLWTRIQLAALWVWEKLVTVAQWALNVAMDANIFALVVIAIIALVAALVILYKHSKTFRDIVDSVWSKLKAVADWIVTKFTKIVPEAFKFVINWVKANWIDIVTWILFPFPKLLIKAAQAFGLVDKVKAGFHDVLGVIKDWGSSLLQWFGNLPGTLWNKAQKMGVQIKNGFVAGIKGFAGVVAGIIQAAINAPIEAWNNLSIPGFHKTIGAGPLKTTIGWGDIALPDIPLVSLAQGGITSGPTMAILGDNPGGREAIVPLPRQGGIGDSTVVNVTVQGSILTQREFEASLIRTLEQYGRRNGRVRLSPATTS